MSDSVFHATAEPSFDTAGLIAKANAFANSAPPPAAPAATPAAEQLVTAGEPTITPAEAVAAKPAAVPGAPPPAAAAPGTPQVFEAPDNALVKVIVDGNETLMPWKDARAQIMLRAKFTKEMQALRAREGQVENVAGQARQVLEKADRHDQLQVLLTNPEYLAQYIAKAFPGQFTRAEARAAALEVQHAAGVVPGAAPPVRPPAPSFDPGSLASLGEVDQLAAAKVAAVEQALGMRLSTTEKALVSRIEQLLGQVDERVEAKLQVIQDAEEVSQYNTQVRSTVTALQESFPVLTAIPNLEGLLRWEVTQLKPRTPEEMVEGLQIVATAIANDAAEKINNSNTSKLVAAAKLATHGIEPPASAPAGNFQRPLTYRDAKGGFSWDALTAAAKTYKP